MKNDEYCNFLLDKFETYGLTNTNYENISEEKIGAFIFLYLLFSAREQGKSVSKNLKELFFSVSIPEDLRKKIEPYINESEDFAEINLDRYSQTTIRGIFFRTCCAIKGKFSVTKITEHLWWIIDCFLNVSEKDSFADFYSDENYSYHLFVEKKITNITFFNPDTESWIFNRISHELTGLVYYEKCINEDVTNDSFNPGKKYNKIFAFPPIYQKANNIKSPNNVRYVQNVQRTTEDKTETLINKVINSLEDGGRAVVLVSNALFTRTYSDYQNKLVKDKYLTYIINLPLGTIYPKNINASILVFNKTTDNKGIHFVDLRSFGPSQDTLRHFENVFQYVNQELVLDLLQSTKSEYSRFVNYEEIINKDCDLNNSTYIGIDFNNININIIAEELLSYENKREKFILGKEAVIFRGLQDTSVINEIDPSTLDPQEVFSSRLIKITDIVDNRITDSMAYIEDVNKSFEKFKLTERDIIISKTTTPIKVAIPDDKNIYPAANFFIIRINEDSELNRYYLKCYLESKEGLKQLKRLDSGGALPSFTKGNLEKIEIPYMKKIDQHILEQKYQDYENKILKMEMEIRIAREEQRRLVK